MFNILLLCAIQLSYSKGNQVVKAGVGGGAGVGEGGGEGWVGELKV